MTVDPFFNDRATIGVFERAFYAGREAAEEIDAILEWRARPRRVLDVGCNAGLHALRVGAARRGRGRPRLRARRHRARPPAGCR